nr:hypothetical protein CFP56_62623 [Quercus suber]
MEEPFVTRDFVWIESSGSDVSADPFAYESDLSSQNSGDLDALFARHKPLLEVDPDSIHMQHLFWSQNTGPMPNPPSSIPSDQVGQTNNTLHWTWVNEARTFMTNGELREATKSSSAIESDSETVVMFNLDKLNEDRPIWLRGAAWERGQIPESTEGLIDPLVSRVDRDRLRVEIGGSSNGPNIRESNVMAQTKAQPNP